MTALNRSSAELWLWGLYQSQAAPAIKEKARELVDEIGRLRDAERSDLFLTVVMRTQGRKQEAFQDALLCLLGQSDQSFELLIMAHNVDQDTVQNIRSVVQEQPPSFRQRITVHEVHGGGRAHPLNVAIGLGKGDYFAFFDDDDLLFGHWVESFHSGADRMPGQLVRTVAAIQEMRPEKWPSDIIGFRSITGPMADRYPGTFEWCDHLEANHSPFMSMAFPRELFTLWGERFDEILEVCEDWDMILRGALLLGVVSVEELTAIYRLWGGITSSYTEHERSEWMSSEKRVRDKLNSRPFLIQAGGYDSTVNSLNKMHREYDIRIQELLGTPMWRATVPIRKAKNLAGRSKRFVQRELKRGGVEGLARSVRRRVEYKRAKDT